MNTVKIRKNDTLETKIVKAYIQLQNVNKVAEFINDLGYRIKTDSRIGSRKYRSNDISNVLNEKVLMLKRN